MRVVFFGQSGPYAPVVLRYLLSQDRAYEIVAVVEGRKRGAGSRTHERLSPRPGSWPSDGQSLSALAVAAGVPVLRTRDVNDGRAVAMVGTTEPHWLLCVGFDRLFGAALLATASAGGINVHPSQLPQLRGPSPIFWALRRGLRETAVSVHGLDVREDHGPIYAQKSFALPHMATAEEIYGLAGQVAAPLVHGLLEQAVRGSLHGTPQDHARATRAPRPRPEDVQVVPGAWTCEHLVDFACGAPFFRAPWLRLGEDTFFIRRGLRAEPARSLSAEYVLQGTVLVVRCQDGVAHLEIQV